MDPNTLLRDLEALIVDAPGDRASLDSLCADLQTWIWRNGFLPSWRKYPAAAGYLRNWQDRQYRECMTAVQAAGA
jgi:hypothetical protein